MALLNYTSTVAAGRTAEQISATLAKHGASQVLIDYGEGGVDGLAFAIPTEFGVMRYRLPVDIGAIEKVMRGDRTIPPRYKTVEQAERTAWRILKDWIEAQLALVETRMVSLDEVMLPYLLMGEQTAYELFREQRLAIGPGS